jgi:hypothetical protein
MVWKFKSQRYSFTSKKIYGERCSIFKNEHVECEGCALGNKHRNEFPMRTNKWRRDFIELVHIDVCGPMLTKLLEGASYFLIFIDDRPTFLWVYY